MFLSVLYSLYLVKWMCILSHNYSELARCTINIDCSNGYICDGNLFCRIKSNNTDYTYCTKGGILCKEGEGGCNLDSECEGTLVCGTNNCPTGPSDLNCCSGNEIGASEFANFCLCLICHLARLLLLYLSSWTHGHFQPLGLGLWV